MDAYLNDYLKLSAYSEFIGEIIFPSKGKKNSSKTSTKTIEFPLRGFGRFKPTYNVVNETSALDELRMSKPAPIRGLGRDGEFYNTLSEKFKKETFTISEIKYNYWRGAGKPQP